MSDTKEMRKRDIERGRIISVAKSVDWEACVLNDAMSRFSSVGEAVEAIDGEMVRLYDATAAKNRKAVEFAAFRVAALLVKLLAEMEDKKNGPTL